MVLPSNKILAIKADAGSYCPNLWIDGSNKPWGDQNTATGSACAKVRI